MKLFRHIITDDDTVPPEPELIGEGESVDDLKDIATKEAGSLKAGLEESMWMFYDNSVSYHELTIENTVRFVIRV